MEAYFETFLEISVLCGGVVLIIGLLSPFLKKNHTVFWRYLLWIILSIRLLLPFDLSVSSPVVTIPLPVHVQQKYWEDKGFTENIEEKETDLDFEKTGTIQSEAGKTEEDLGESRKQTEHKDSAVAQMTSMSSEQKKDSFRFSKVIFPLWAGITLLLFLTQAGSYWSFRKKVERTRVYLFQKENVPVFYSPLVKSPMLLGVRKPQILLPDKEYKEEQLTFILKHELTHYKRKDLWVKLLLASARTLHWFNPLIYFMEKRASEDIELLCDSQVVHGFTKEEKKRYSEMLLESASRRNSSRGILCTSEFSKETKTLKERFFNIFSNENRKKGVFAALLGVGIIFFISFFVVFGYGKMENPVSDEAASETPEASEKAGSQRLTSLPELSIEEAASSIYGAVFPQLIYVSSSRAILYDYWGLMVYDVENQRIEQLLDLPAAGLGFIQGDTVTHIEASSDGKQLLLYNEPDTVERYVYYIDDKRLEHSDLTEFKGNHYDGLAFMEEKQYALTEDGKMAYLTMDSLVTEEGEEFHPQDMQGLSLVISDRSLGTAKVYPLFRSYYSQQEENKAKIISDNLKWRDIKRRVIVKEYLYLDSEGWYYYLEEDRKKESRINEFAEVLEPLLLVRYKNGERQVLEDLMVQSMWAECPVLFVDDRIIYKAAKMPDVASVKDPVLVSIALDGSNRRTADDILYHTFDSLCEDNGWIYYSGWTNDGAFPRPLCRIPADFSSGAQLVDELPGLLCGVMDGYAFYLSDEEKKAGIWRRNLTTGEEQIHDKWGLTTDDIAYFNCRERWFEPGSLRDEAIEGCMVQFSRDWDGEAYSYAVPFYIP